MTILSIYNILLSLKSLYNPDQCVKKVFQPPPQQPAEIICHKIAAADSDIIYPKFDLALGHWDNSRNYKHFDNFQTGDRFFDLSEEYLVCLATQTSIEKMHSLPQVIYACKLKTVMIVLNIYIFLWSDMINYSSNSDYVFQVAQNWEGPISAAVFAAGDDELNILLLYVFYLRQCFLHIKDQVTFHLLSPKDRFPKSSDIDYTMAEKMDCSRPDVTLQQLMKTRNPSTGKWRIKNPYPQNHMRNLARKNCQTRYTFLTDVDIIPSNHLAQELNQFLQQVTCKNLCAYVIPTYELDERVRFPPNKTELIRLANKGLARPFHHKVFIFNQFATNFTR